MLVNHYNAKNIAVLKALAKYKFLCHSQMIRLGIDKYKSNLSTSIKKLIEGRYPLVQKIPHQTGTVAKFYLTKKGKDVLITLQHIEEEKIMLPKGTIFSDTQDTLHRTHIIDIQIELDLACQECNIEILFCDRYFDTTGNNRIDKNLSSKTAIIFEGKKTIKADMIFMLQIEQQQKELYLVELEMGKNSKKSLVKLIEHGKAILKGSANQKYNHQKGYRTLWIFEHQSIMEATIERAKENGFFENLKEYFLFKSLDEIDKENFFVDWRNLAGSNRKLYYAKQVS